MILRGRGQLFRIKVFLSPCDPLFFQKNRLGAPPLRTPPKKGTSRTFLGFEFSCRKLAGSFFGAGCGGKGAYALCLCVGWVCFYFVDVI